MVKIHPNVILFKRALLILSILTFIVSDVKWIDYQTQTNSATYIHTRDAKVKTVGVDFKGALLPYYVEITVTPDSGFSTPVLCFSPTSQDCSSDREALIKRTDKKPGKLYIKKEQFEGKNLYINIKCVEDNCGYSLTANGTQAAQLDQYSVYSYLVADNNKDMNFEVIGNASNETYLTIGIEGTKAELSVDGIRKTPTYLGNGRIMTFPLDQVSYSNNVLAKFQIKNANKGDYINVNVHVVENARTQDNLLYPNGPAVMGMLDSTEGDNGIKEECFPVSALGKEFGNTNKFYLTGRIYSKYALFWLANEHGDYMEETEQEISDGLLSHLIDTQGKARSVCFEFSYEPTVKMYYAAYSVSILDAVSLKNEYNFYPPQVLGETYRRMIPVGSYAVYHTAKLEKSNKRVSYNMYNRKGATELYVKKCSTFPECIYKPDEIKNMQNEKVKQIGKMSIWESEVDRDCGTLDSTKNVMIVYCREDGNDNKGYCEVDTSAFIPEQEIVLVENQKFSKYAQKDEKGTFIIDLKGGVKLQRITVDIMVMSGDINFGTQGPLTSGGPLRDEEIDIHYYKYHLSNKVFIHYNFAQLSFDKISILYKAELNSFFTIQYGLNSFNLIQLEETVPSGESYLVQIDPTTSEKYKNIYLQNYRYKKKKPFLANFFALNCEFKVTRGDAEVPFFDGYAQEVLKEDSPGYESTNYTYKIQVLEPDPANYNHKMCMLYVAGYESKDPEYETEIVVAENINQQVIFNDNFKAISFLYPHADPDKDLAIHVNIIDQANYAIRIYAKDRTHVLKSLLITRSNIYFISRNEIRNVCEKNTLCSIIVDASFESALPNMVKTDPMIEITIRQIKNSPSYLQKGQAKMDFTCGDLFYYLYTEIGRNEIGEISVNFLRDFGKVWGRVVRKNLNSPEDGANWRGLYRLPREDWGDGINYNGYIKKFVIGVEETKDCLEGCYLLLSIQISQIGDYVSEHKFYPFSIITKVSPTNHAYNDIPKVVIQVNEYIVGNVDVSENERISQFYEVWIPHDTYRIEFDWQSEVAGLYINVGGNRPTTKNAHFKLLPPGRDSMQSIDKWALLNKAAENKIAIPNKDSLQDLNLVIGIWTDKTDSVDTEVFSLRIHEPNEDLDVDINEVNSDQKILCSPRYFENDLYRCLFMVTYDDDDVDLEMPLIIHASSLNNSAVTNTYASFIIKKEYDEFNFDQLRRSIPTSQTAEFNTFRDESDYIYTKLQAEHKGKYLFVNVVTDTKDEIMILTSIPMFNMITEKNYEFYPNPSTEQLLALTTDKLNLGFFTTSSLIINIVCLGGEATINWRNDNNIYHLRDRGDTLTMTSGAAENMITITSRNTTITDPQAPKFVFYISYHVRNKKSNFDEIKYGKSVEIGYKNTDLPVFLYSKVGSYSNDINIAVTFKDLDFETTGFYNTPPLSVLAAVAKENTIYNSKKNPELAPSQDKSFKGSYDPALKTAQVVINRADFERMRLKEEDNPTVYLSINKVEGYNMLYYIFNIEAQVTKVNEGVIPVEKTFNYGRYTGYFSNYYKLRNNKKKTYMILELAFNSDYLNFAINNVITRSNNTDYIVKEEEARGKKILTIKPPQTIDFIYLNIFKKQPTVDNDLLLNNYVFKYINVEKPEEFSDYKIYGNNNEIKYEETKNGKNTEITCTFNKLDIEKGKANITYFFKVVENSTHVYGEKYETISVMESPYATAYARNPDDNNGKITLKASGELSNWCYLEVIAQIQQDTIIEYVAYKGISNVRPPSNKSGDGSNGENNNTVVFLVILGILFALIAGLAIVVFIFQQRSKNLLNQVKHVSFQQNAATTNSDPDLLLQKK